MNFKTILMPKVIFVTKSYPYLRFLTFKLKVSFIKAKNISDTAVTFVEDQCY